MLAQVDPVRAAETVARGGTEGLIYALCFAIIGLAFALVWLAKRHLDRQDSTAAEATQTQKEHAAIMAALQREHAAQLLALQHAATEDLRNMLGRVTAALSEVSATAESMAAGMEALQDTARLLEFLLDQRERGPRPQKGRP